MRSRQLTVYMRSVFEKNYLLGVRRAAENGLVAEIIFSAYLSGSDGLWYTSGELH